MYTWRRTRGTTEHQNYLKKFLDRGKDSLKRLKALKLGLEKSSAVEVKQFFTEHSNDVFYVVYTSFTNVETNIQEKLAKNKGYNDLNTKDLLEHVLPMLRQIFISLPELIHQKWQFNSICLIVRKLLHPGNHMKLRYFGLQLLLLWVEALQENAGDPCMELFASAVPHFPPQKTPMGLPLTSNSNPTPSTVQGVASGGLIERYGVYSNGTASSDSLAGAGKGEGQYRHSSPITSVNLLTREVVQPNVLIPLAPNGSDQQRSAASPTEELMTCLLEGLSRYAHWLHWDDPMQSLRGFAHLFFLFKLFYLACLYKDFQKDAGLYTPPQTPALDSLVGTSGKPSASERLHSVLEEPTQDRLCASGSDPTCAALASSRSSSSSLHSRHKKASPYRVSAVIKLEYDLSNPIYGKIKNLILKYVLQWFQTGSSNRGAENLSGAWPPPPSVLLPCNDSTPSGTKLIQKMWFTSRDNVSLLLEIFRQGFSHPTPISTTRLVVDLYRSWYQATEKPAFMQTPPVQSVAQSSASTSSPSLLSDTAREALLAQPGRRSPTMPEGSAPRVLSWEQLSRYRGFKAEGVEAGFNASIAMIVSHSQQVFSPSPDSGQDMSNQVELCRKVIRLIQDMVVGSVLDRSTWEFLLSVLLYHIWDIFTRKDSTLARELAAPLLKTLLVCFLRASGSVEVREGLWDSLLEVLQSLTNWQEVITQWKVAMLSMTEVLAQAVYGLSLQDLPLDVLSTTPHRKRVHSMERQTTTGGLSMSHLRRDHRFSKFGDISVIQLEQHLRGLSRRTTIDLVGGGGEDGREQAKLSRGSLGAIQEYRSQASSLDAKEVNVTEAANLKEGSEGTGESARKTEGTETAVVSSERIDKPAEVLVNSDPASPISDAIFSHRDSEESLETIELDSLPGQPLLSSSEVHHGGGKKSRRSPATGIFKHRSPDAKHRKRGKASEKIFEGEGGFGSLTRYSPLLSYDDDSKNGTTTGGKWRKKKNTNHKRSGSDTTSRSVSSSPRSLAKSNLVHTEEELEESTDPKAKLVRTPTVTRKNFGRKLSIPKSASEGNICRLSLNPGSIGVPGEEGLSPDYSFRRVSTLGSPKGTSESSSVQDLTVVIESPSITLPAVPGNGGNMSMSLPPSNGGKPIVHRSMTVDSSESDRIIWQEDHTPIPPPISPTFGGGYLSSGWRREVAAATWLRMLKILGNINKIKDDHIHAEALGALRDIWTTLSKIRANSGISMNTDEPTPPLPKYMPPCELFLPWVVQACSLPAFPSPSSSRLQGRRIAYQLLCEMTITHWHTPPSLSHLSHFYRLLHIALNSDMAAVVIKHGCFLYSYGLSGASVLLRDCVDACDSILSSSNSTAPHNEALYMIGTLLYLPPLPVTLPSHSSSSSSAVKLNVAALKEKMVRIIYRSAMRERGRIGRCIALYQVGILVFSELWKNKGSQSKYVEDGLDILLSSLKFMDRGVCMCAIDMVSMLSEVAPQMADLYPSLPSRVIQAICFALAVLMTEEADRGSWIEKVVITLLLLLRDWLMAIPFLPADTASTSSSYSSPSPASSSSAPPPPLQLALPASTVRTVFEILQAAMCSQQVLLAQSFSIVNPISGGGAAAINPLETSGSRSSVGARIRHTSEERNGSEELQASRTDSTNKINLSWDKLKKSKQLFSEGRIQMTARSVLTHLMNLLGHFPFGCGAAQLCSSIKEYHDCPSLSHLDDLSPEIFDSPRIQFFAFGDEAVVTLVEIPSTLEGVPEDAITGHYQTRVIVRDVTGKYTWDSSLLYGPQKSPFQGEAWSLTAADSIDSLPESVDAATNCDTPATLESWGSSQSDPLMPPSWRTHVNGDRDVLQDLLEHIAQTSPECVVEGKGHASVKMGGAGFLGDEITLLRMLSGQDSSESKYNLDATNQPYMLGEKSATPPHDSHTMAFHHCRVFLSHLGLLSWDKRCHLNLLDKTNQLILELKNLDQLNAQSRATYKVAVLYVAPGQEDKAAILSNTSGSCYYEEFVAGLGWEVDMGSHAGYMAGMQKEFASCSMPYYATSSEEVLFHVSTRMTSRMEQKVRHLGNDEVHIVWSEHWRDYRRSLFRTQFADVLIVLYPLSNGLIRVQLNKKPNVPQFGPLFNGAVVSRNTVAPLVRATAINALRAQRTPLVGYRGRYEERLRYIQNITKNQVQSTYEEFCENVMHPLEMGSSQSLPTCYSQPTAPRASPLKVPSVAQSPVSLTSLLRSRAHNNVQLHQSTPHLLTRHTTTSTLSTHHSNLSDHLATSFSSSRLTGRPRSITNEDRILTAPESRLSSPSQSWTSSVPDNLHHLTSSPHSMRSKTTPDLNTSPRTSRKKNLSQSSSKGHT